MLKRHLKLTLKKPNSKLCSLRKIIVEQCLKTLKKKEKDM